MAHHLGSHCFIVSSALESVVGNITVDSYVEREGQDGERPSHNRERYTEALLVRGLVGGVCGICQ